MIQVGGKRKREKAGGGTSLEAFEEVESKV